MAVPLRRPECAVKQAFSSGTADSKGLWMGTAVNDPRRRLRCAPPRRKRIRHLHPARRYASAGAEKLEHVAIAEPGDFIFVPPYEVHMEENLDTENEAELLLARNSQEQIVVNVPDPREG